MPRRTAPQPRKFSIVMLLVLLLAIFGTVMMMMDIKPTQTVVEEELDATTFLTQKQ